jgi:type I restriction enzyme, S subunit
MGSDWKETTLGALLKFANGKTSPERAVHFPYAVYGSNGIIGKSKRTNADTNSIIIGRVGSYCGSVFYSQSACWVTDNAIRAGATAGNIPRFLYYLLKGIDLNHWRGGSGQPLLNQTVLSSIPTSSPSSGEQKAIAHVLGSLDDRIELNRRMNGTLEAMAQALFKSWFVDFDPVIDNALAGGKEIPAELSEKAQARAVLGDKRRPLPEEIRTLFPDEFTYSDELGWIPKGWDVGCLEDMVTLQRGFDLPKTKRTRGNFPLIAASGQDGTHNKARVTGPGVVTGRSGKLGIVNFVQENFWPLNTTLWVKKYENSTPYHAYQLLSTLGLERYNSGSAVPTLNRNHVHGMRLLVPPILIIREFSLHSEAMFDKITENQSQGITLTNLRDTLLPKLLSGELRIPDAEKMVEELAL